MATLEKIRSKSVLLIVVIGVALLAFIIGDALTNSRNIFGDPTTIAKIGSSKIDISEYQRKREELNNQFEEARKQNPEQFANFDTQLLPQMALDQLVQETVLNNAVAKAGIRSTPNILKFYMLENPNNPKVQELMQALQSAGIAAQSPAQAYDIIFNPKRNGLTEAQVEPLQRAWLTAENETDRLICQQIYQRLLVGTVKANDLDRKALYNDYVATQNVEVAFMPFGQLSEKEYPVSEAEIKEAYNKEKGRFAVEEDTREISFIAVPVMASDADIDACRKLATTTINYMNANKGGLSKELKNEGVSFTHHSYLTEDVPQNMRFAMTNPVDTAALAYLNNEGFAVTRINSITQEVDSVQLTLVQTATEAIGSKVLAALNAGLSVDSLSTRFSVDSVAAQVDQWVTLFNANGPTNAISKQQLDSLQNASGKYISMMAGPQGMLIGKIVKQNAPKTVYNYDEASYVLGPSNATMTAERSKLEKFLSTNNDAAKFAANAAKAGYNLQNFVVTASTPAIPRFAGMNQYYPESRQVMRWVMIDGKKGDVSHIYESESLTSPILYVAAVNNSYDKFAPVESKNVKDYLTERIRCQKAGDKLAANYSKKAQSLASAAQAMGVQPRNIAQFRFGQNPGVNDPEIVGKIAGTPANKKVIVTKGMDGIYVYQVMGNARENFPFNDQQYDQQYFQFVNPDLFGMLKGTAKYKNNIYKFEAGD